MTDHTHSINRNAITWETLVGGVSKNVLDEVAQERKDALERLRIEAAYADLDQLQLDQCEVGTVIRFCRTAHTAAGAKELTYAALFVDDRWWITGSTTPNGIATEDLLSWMIRLDIGSDDIEWMDIS